MDNEIELTFVGDIFPANLDSTIGFGIASELYRHNGHPWEKSIKEITQDSDFVFGNLESPLSFDENEATTISFLGSYKFAAFLKECGFSVLSVANNHILEKGEKGFIETINILNNANIEPVGFQKKYNSNLVIFEKNDIKLGFAAYNSVHDIENPNLYADFSIDKTIGSLNRMNNSGVNCKIIN